MEGRMRFYPYAILILSVIVFIFPSDTATQEHSLNISGVWQSSIGLVYEIEQSGTNFTWYVASLGQAGEGTIEGERLQASWQTGRGSESASGLIVEADDAGRALRIEWSNKVVFHRQPPPHRGEMREDARHGKPPSEPRQDETPRDHMERAEHAPDISGAWKSSTGRMHHIIQTGVSFSWTVEGTNEEAAGMIEGERLVVEWSGRFGAGHAEGHIIEIDPHARVLAIEWTNGVMFKRPEGERSRQREQQAQRDEGESSPPVAIQHREDAESPPPVEIQQREQIEQPPSVEIQQAVLSKDALKKLIPHLSLKTAFNQWVKVGGPIGGLGYDVRYQSHNPRGKQIMFVTDNYSGVNKSMDGGKNWFASNMGVKGRSGVSGDAIPVFSLTVDPNKSNIVWMGLKDVKGVYKSTDGGMNWHNVTPEMREKEFVFRGFTIMPGNSNIVFAQGELPTGEQGKGFSKVKGRIYQTKDGGQSWKKMWEGNDLVRYVIVNPVNHKILFASCGIFDREAFNSNCKSPTLQGQDLEASRKDRGGVGVLRSINGGETWEELNRKNGLTDLYVGSLVMHPDSPEVLLAGCGNNAASHYTDGKKWYRTGGVFRTTDGGDSWIHVLKNEIITSVEFSPSNPNIAYAGARQAFFMSKDAGHTWTPVAGGKYAWGPPGVIAGFPIDILVDPSNPSVLFANNYGGGNVKSTNGGRGWTMASQGYTGALMFDLAIHPFNSEIVYAGAKSGLFKTENSGSLWKGLSHPPAEFPECYSVALHPKNPNIVVASQELSGRVYHSTDGGQTWKQAFRLQPPPGAANQKYGFKRIVFAPSHPRDVYAATCSGINQIKDHPVAFGVYKSTDAGAPGSWKEANSPVLKKQAVTDIAVHPKNHFKVYAATVKGGLFRSTDAGSKWTVPPGLANKDVRSVAIDPNKPHIVYAGLHAGGVYRSQDDGNTWHRMAAGMDDKEPVWALVVDPAGYAWAGTRRSGVFRWDDIEQQWIKVNKGLSTKAVIDLEISKDGKVLYAATTGEGVFRYEKR
jgi:photosystem II stability/assembly factor-like uncharacterized protein